MKSFVIYAVIAVAGAFLLWRLSAANPGALDSEYATQDLIYMLALLVLVGPGVFLAFKDNIGGAFKSVAAWVGVLLLAIALYALRDDLLPVWHKMKAELSPAGGMVTASGEVELIRTQDGHFYADANVNGQTIRFMVDTGASRVSLSYDDAVRVGIDPNSLTYNAPMSTANGMALSALTRLDFVAIGPLRVEKVRASVSKQGQMDGSLLGLTFLDELGGYRVEGDTLILWQ